MTEVVSGQTLTRPVGANIPPAADVLQTNVPNYTFRHEVVIWKLAEVLKNMTHAQSIPNGDTP